jgi:hypothetical protein
MSDHVIFIGWGEAIPGREAKALAVFGEVMEFYTGLQQRGDIESFQPVALEAHGGELSGFLLVRGEAEKLRSLRASDEFVRLNTRARLVVLNYGVVGGVTGSELSRRFEMSMADVQQLAG